MPPAERRGSTALSFGMGCLGALIALGLLLALAWLLPLSQSGVYKLVTLVIVTLLSFVAGGYVSGRLAGRDRVRYGLALGLVLGIVDFVYVLGPSWILIAAIPCSGFAGALGGWLAERWPKGAKSSALRPQRRAERLDELSHPWGILFKSPKRSRRG